MRRTSYPSRRNQPVAVALDLVAFDDTHAIFEPMPDEYGVGFFSQLTLGQGYWRQLGSPRRIKFVVEGA